MKHPVVFACSAPSRNAGKNDKNPCASRETKSDKVPSTISFQSFRSVLVVGVLLVLFFSHWLDRKGPALVTTSCLVLWVHYCFSW